MYVNERGEVNYHGFIKSLRERQKISTQVACKGVCTLSAWNRFENGNRLAEKLMGDRLVARLGVSGEKYEDYLRLKEYMVWLHRMRIVKTIEDKNIETAKAELAAYGARPRLNSVNKQFVWAMHYLVLHLEGASEVELLDAITRAVKCTVSNVPKALAGAQLLCDQEINLIAEQMRLAIPKKKVKDVNAWRISEYEKLIAYIDASRWEKLQKAKLYPKLAYYIGQLLLERDASEQEFRRGLEVCHQAMELLRDTSRSFYLIELAETMEQLGVSLLSTDMDPKERADLEAKLQEISEWKCAVKELREEYNLEVYMSDFCYLYYETECYNMVEVLEKRRTMLGLSRMRLSKGICTERTIIRCEREGANLSIDVMRNLYERMGLCAEYRRAQMVTTDVEAVNAYYSELTRAVNRQDYDKALNCIEELKDKVDMNLPYNKQELERMENYVLYRSKKIDAEEFARRIAAILGYSVDISKLKQRGMHYFTRAELSCLHDLAFEVQSDISSLCLGIIEKICFEAMKENFEDSKLAVYRILMERVASQLGDAQRYEESNKISHIILKECVKHYRMDNLSSLVYNQIWNYEQECDYALLDKKHIADKLQLCESLSKLIKKYNAAAFFQKKKDSM